MEPLCIDRGLCCHSRTCSRQCAHRSTSQAKPKAPTRAAAPSLNPRGAPICNENFPSFFSPLGLSATHPVIVFADHFLPFYCCLSSHPGRRGKQERNIYGHKILQEYCRFICIYKRAVNKESQTDRQHTIDLAVKKGSKSVGRTLGPPLRSGDLNRLPTKIQFFI